jgi:hypothetical protein
VRYILAALLVLIGGLCRQRESGKAAVVGGANFCVTAEEADEIYFVLVHDFVSVLLNFPILLGSHKAKPSEWARLPSAEALHLRRLRRNLFAVLCEQDLPGYRNQKGGAAEAEERVAAGRRYCPEAVTEQMAGYRTGDALWTKVTHSNPGKRGEPK